MRSWFWRVRFGPSEALPRNVDRRDRLRIPESVQPSKGEKKEGVSGPQPIHGRRSNALSRATEREPGGPGSVESEPGSGRGPELARADDPNASGRQAEVGGRPVGTRPSASLVADASVPCASATDPIEESRSSTHGERPIAQRSPLGDDDTSNSGDDESSSARPNDNRPADLPVDKGSVQDDSAHTVAAASGADSHRPLDVQPEQEHTAGRSPDRGDRTAVKSGATASSSFPAGLTDDTRHHQEASPDGDRPPSTGERRSGSGDKHDSQSLDEPPTPRVDGPLRAIGNSRRPGPRRPTPRVDAREYAALYEDATAVDLEYTRWNDAIVKQLLLAVPSSDKSLLCVNPRILSQVSEDSGLGSMSPEQAEQQFTTAVASVYQRRVLGHEARLRVLRRCASGGPPRCVAFLACSVLAALHMQTDEELPGTAYYKRLADLLRCGMQNAHPLGFDPQVFESLWMFLRNWLRAAHGRELAMPTSVRGFRRFVALPLAHVPLRSLDIEKLPMFFSWAGYKPGARLRHDHLLGDLKRWQRSTSSLTPTGADALRDDRSSAVSSQVSAELRAWDGACSESANSRSARVEIQFDVVQRSPVLCYLPRRPPGFPRVFEDGQRVFEASGDGWYDPAQLHPEDGGLLEHGFEWRAHSNGVYWALRRSGELVIPFSPSSSYSGFLSGRRMLRGIACSVLCRDSILPTVKDYLCEVAQEILRPVSHPQLPDGWSIFRDVSAQVHVDAPSGLEALEVDPDVELIVSGGLRIGRSWSWLHGAPPQVLASGLKPNDRVRVNGAAMEVDASGVLRTDMVFQQSGQYLVEAGTQQRTIHIVGPEVAARRDTKPDDPVNATHGRRIALPRGSWTLLGSSPFLVYRSRSEFFHGTVVSCPFDPSWAVQVGPGPGGVVAVAGRLRPPQFLSLRGLTRQKRKLIARWSNTIYAAHIRRPRFVGLGAVIPDEDIASTWKTYVSLTKEIKRSLKHKQ